MIKQPVKDRVRSIRPTRPVADVGWLSEFYVKVARLYVIILHVTKPIKKFINQHMILG